jgi:hypothetical protein
LTQEIIKLLGTASVRSDAAAVPRSEDGGLSA